MTYFPSTSLPASSQPRGLTYGPPPKHLVWLQTAFLGDIILTTAAMQLVAEEWPGVAQHLITTPLGCKALAGHPALTSCTPFAKGATRPWRAFQQVKASLHGRGISPQQSVLLQAHRSSRSSLLAAYLGLPTVTYEETQLAFLATTTLPRIAVLAESARIALLLEGLGMPREKILACQPQLVAQLLPQEDLGWQGELSRWRGKLIGLAPGSVWGTKRWPLASFCQLAEALMEESDLGLVLIGSNEEKALTSAIAAHVQRKVASGQGRLWDLAGRTSLDDLRFVFPRLSLLVANDSSPIHYGSAFKVPTLALFGATIPEMGFGPTGPGSCSVGVEGLDCRPCSDHGPQSCPLQHFRCMNDLQPGPIATRCRKMLTPPSSAN